MVAFRRAARRMPGTAECAGLTSLCRGRAVSRVSQSDSAVDEAGDVPVETWHQSRHRAREWRRLALQGPTCLVDVSIEAWGLESRTYSSIAAEPRRDHPYSSQRPDSPTCRARATPDPA